MVRLITTLIMSCCIAILAGCPEEVESICLDNESCGGHGQCNVNGIVCDCDEGYAGDWCEKCSEGYEMDSEGLCIKTERIEYRCKSTNCGADIEKRTCEKDFCSEWESFKDCGENDICVSDEKGVRCKACELGCNAGQCSQCTSGPCCSENGFFLKSDKTCQEGSEFRCSGEMCGDDVERRTWVKLCDGTSSDCSGNVVYTDWFIQTDCKLKQLCSDTRYSQPECSTCEHGCKKGQCNECSSGPCCDEDGDFQSTTIICDDWLEYKCKDGACGSFSQYRKVSMYCSGDTAECNGATDDPLWVPYESCNYDQLCVADGNTSAACVTCEHGCKDGACFPECNPESDRCCGNGGKICCWYKEQTLLEWQNPAPNLKLNRQEAINYCANLTLCESENWRLPSVEELKVICPLDPELEGPDMDWCWSSTKKENGQDYYYCLAYVVGCQVQTCVPVHQHYFRCVRNKPIENSE